MLVFSLKAYRLERLLLLILSFIALVVWFKYLGFSLPLFFFLFWCTVVLIAMVEIPLTQRIKGFFMKYPIAVLFMTAVEGHDPGNRNEFTIRDVDLEEFLRLLRSYPIITFNTEEDILYVEAKKRLGTPVVMHSMFDKGFNPTAVFAYAVMSFQPGTAVESGTAAELLADASVSYQIWVSKRLKLMKLKSEKE